MAEEAMDEETMYEEAMSEEAMTMSQPETAGEDCDAIKDRNELRLDIESPAVVINNDIARPGDACDFHMLYIDGMSKGVNSNGIVQLSITCDSPDDVEVALSGPGGFDYRHGASNGQRYACGDTWTESVNYQSDKVFFTVYIRPFERPERPRIRSLFPRSDLIPRSLITPTTGSAERRGGALHTSSILLDLGRFRSPSSFGDTQHHARPLGQRRAVGRRRHR